MPQLLNQQYQGVAGRAADKPHLINEQKRPIIEELRTCHYYYQRPNEDY